MKIIRVDNFDRETVSDALIAENVSVEYAQIITKFLNEKYSSNISPIFFRAESDDYKLYKYEP